ncbi:hypothetical protein HDU84_000648 [Entophlyctis sp. JEL0112]|nr:hypothetical protein HDU84_000648 [Entophlyctis sp. JEL0112]
MPKNSDAQTVHTRLAAALAAPHLRARLKAAIARTIAIPDTRKLPSAPSPATRKNLESVDVSVLQTDTWSAAELLASSGGRALVLDFASDTNPGGAWRSSNQQGTQEEAICRTSSLGIQLEACTAYPIPTYGAVLVPEVAFFSKDGNPLWCAVVAAALRANGAPEKYVDSKVDGILRIAAHYGYQQLVLGAWGCGAFGADAKVVAECFRRAITRYNESLERVVFAIRGREQWAVFAAVFGSAADTPK